MTEFTLSRRGFLASACCLAAAPIVTPVTFAAMPGENRFVTIVLRGAMDGLSPTAGRTGDAAEAASFTQRQARTGRAMFFSSTSLIPSVTSAFITASSSVAS